MELLQAKSYFAGQGGETMSYSNRDRAQRKLKQAQEAMERSLTYCAEVALDYKNHTPEVAKALEGVGEGISMVEEALISVRQMF